MITSRITVLPEASHARSVVTVRVAKVVGVLSLYLLIVGIFFSREGLVSSNALLTSLALVSIGTSIFLRRRLSFNAPSSWVYGFYFVALTVTVLLSSTPQTWAEYGRQVLFLGVLFATVRHADQFPTQRGLLALLIACMLIVVTQAAWFSLQGAPADRLSSYPSVMQWSGYPELGLIAALGASGAFAIATAAPRLSLRLAAAILAGMFTVGALLLYSRSAWITIFILAVWTALVGVVRWRRWLPLVLLVTLVAGVALTARSAPLLGRYIQTLSSWTESSEMQARREGWNAASAMLKDHLWFGIGPGMYPVAYVRYGKASDPVHAYSLVLHVAAEIGIVGLTAYLLIWLRVLLISFTDAVPTRAGVVAFALHAILLAFFIRSQSEHFLANLGTSFRLLLLLGLLFGLAEAVGRHVSRVDPQSRHPS